MRKSVQRVQSKSISKLKSVQLAKLVACAAQCNSLMNHWRACSSATIFSARNIICSLLWQYSVLLKRRSLCDSHNAIQWNSGRFDGSTMWKLNEWNYTIFEMRKSFFFSLSLFILNPSQHKVPGIVLHSYLIGYKIILVDADEATFYKSKWHLSYQWSLYGSNHITLYRIASCRFVSYRIVFAFAFAFVSYDRII